MIHIYIHDAKRKAQGNPSADSSKQIRFDHAWLVWDPRDHDIPQQDIPQPLQHQHEKKRLYRSPWNIRACRRITNKLLDHDHRLQVTLQHLHLTTFVQVLQQGLRLLIPQWHSKDGMYVRHLQWASCSILLSRQIVLIGMCSTEQKSHHQLRTWEHD